jgi:chorismate mutase
MVVRAVRGAVQVARDEREVFCEAVNRLVKTVLSRNGIGREEIVSVLFSQTGDLVSANPASCVRTEQEHLSAVPLFCTQEPEYPNSLPRVIRLLVTYNTDSGDSSPVPVYIDGAERLRPDLADSSQTQEQ